MPENTPSVSQEPVVSAGTMSFLSSTVAPEHLERLKQQINKTPQGNQQQPPVKTDPATPPADNPATPPNPQDQPAAKPEAPAPDNDNPLLALHDKGGSPVPQFKDLQEFGKYVQEKYAIDNVQTFFNTVDKQRRDSMELPKVKRELDSYNKSLGNLPDDLASALEIHWKTGGKGDYKKAFMEHQAPFDVSKSFSEHDLNDLAKQFMPKANISDAAMPEFIDLTDKTNPATKQLLGMLKDKYDTVQQQWKEKRVSSNSRSEDLERTFSESVDASVNDLTSKLPTVTKGQVDHIKTLIRNGDADSIVYDEAGNIKKEAARNIWWAKNGEKYSTEAIKSQQAIIEKVTQQRDEAQAELEKFLNRGGKQIPVRTAEKTNTTASTAEQKAKEWLNGKGRTSHPLANLGGK